VRRRRADADGGVALVETALVITFLLLLAFGAAELGFMWRDTNRIEHGIQAAGRVGSNAADDRLADYDTLRSLNSVITDLTGGRVERVVIFAATASDGAVPAGCLSVDVTASPMGAHGVSGTCNVYSAQQVAAASSANFGGTTSCAGAWDASYCPLIRPRGSANAAYLGVYVRVVYTPLTTVFTGPIDIARTTVFRLEPCVPAIETCA
jgi:Flp pilus assembly protein TadG